MRTAYFLVVSLLAAGCSASSLPEDTSDVETLDADLTASPLVLGSASGDVKTKKVSLSGQERQDVPSTYQFSCGNQGYYYSTSVSNVAWVELKNPSAKKLSLTVSIDGLPNTRPTLFAYASRQDAVSRCLTFGTSRKLTGQSSVIVEPKSSVFVLVASGSATGLYTLTATTDAVISASSSAALAIDNAEGGVASAEVFVSGAERQDVPSTYQFSCGNQGYYYSTSPSNVGWIEVQNPTSKAASVSVEVTGLPTTRPTMFAYADKNDSVSRCLTYTSNRRLGDASSLVIDAKSSVFVLLSAGSVTGVYKMTATTDELFEP